MAETEQVQEHRLKYLGFFYITVLRAAACLASLYESAKENSGPLKSGVTTVEETVKTVVEPVYHKMEGKPFEVLQFIDKKVDDIIAKLDKNVPQPLKERSYQVYDVARQAPNVAISVTAEVQRNGVIATARETARNLFLKCEPTARELYNKYEPVAEEWTALAWHKLLALPLFPQLVQGFAPTATYWAEKYNRFVFYLADKQYRVGHFLPLLPTEKIEKSLHKGLEGQVHQDSPPTH